MSNPMNSADSLGLIDDLGQLGHNNPGDAAWDAGFQQGAAEGILQFLDTLPTPVNQIVQGLPGHPAGLHDFLGLYDPNAPGMPEGRIACHVAQDAAAGAAGAAFPPVIESGPIRMGPWYVQKGATQKVWRIAFGSRKSFIHGHIHGGNWYKPWRWFQKIGKWKRYD